MKYGQFGGNVGFSWVGAGYIGYDDCTVCNGVSGSMQIDSTILD